MTNLKYYLPVVGFSFTGITALLAAVWHNLAETIFFSSLMVSNAVLIAAVYVKRKED